MRARKTKDLKKALKKKGFVVDPEKDHHEYYVLTIDGVKQNIYTYFSHGKQEYSKSLMGQLKKQLKFQDTKDAEKFFDCPLTKEDYVELLRNSGSI